MLWVLVSPPVWESTQTWSAINSISNKLPRLSLSWVIRSFFSSSLWNRNEKQWDFPATPYNLSIFSNNQLECFLWNNLSRYWIKSLIVERNFRKNAPSNDEEEVNFSFHIVSNLVLVSRLSGFDHCPCGNSDTTASVPKYGLFLVFDYFTKQNFLFRALSGVGPPHNIIGWGLGGGLPENFAPFHQVLSSIMAPKFQIWPSLITRPGKTWTDQTRPGEGGGVNHHDNDEEGLGLSQSNKLSRWWLPLSVRPRPSQPDLSSYCTYHTMYCQLKYILDFYIHFSFPFLFVWLFVCLSVCIHPILHVWAWASCQKQMVSVT